MCRNRRTLHSHHVEFASHGGSDAPPNRTTLCDHCHLKLVHEGKMRITGEAPGNLTFAVGLRPGKPPRAVYRNEIKIA